MSVVYTRIELEEVPESLLSHPEWPEPRTIYTDHYPYHTLSQENTISLVERDKWDNYYVNIVVCINNHYWDTIEEGTPFSKVLWFTPTPNGWELK